MCVCTRARVCGYSVKDAYFSKNWAGMREAGIAARGAYHFGHPGESATAQADTFTRTVGKGASTHCALSDHSLLANASSTSTVSVVACSGGVVVRARARVYVCLSVSVCVGAELDALACV